MKTSLSLLLLAVAATSSVQAAECTTDELMTISEIYNSALDTGTSACPDMTTVTDTADYCVSDCLGMMSDMLDSMPDCSSGGVNIKEALQAAIDYCDSGTADTSDIFTDSASSALTSDSSSLFTSDSSGSSTETSSSSGTSLLRTASPSTDSSSDKATADTQAPSAGSSSASALTAVSSVALAAAAFVIATAL
jgi:mating pheromone-induced death protein 2